MRVRVRGVGGYLPSTVLTNVDLESKTNTTHEWIVQRTGIHQRHVVDTETTSDLGTMAAKKALENAGISSKDIDFIICATTTPDKTFPSTATIIQGNLAMQGFAFDIQAACSGFVYALAQANALLRTGQGKRALVIGAEIFSRLVDWNDRSTCVLFGDGAGAVVLEACPQTRDDTTDSLGILGITIHSDGKQSHLLNTNGGPGSTGHIGNIHMEGREVFRQAVHKLGTSVVEILDAHHLTQEDLQWFVPHQANKRIIDATADSIHLPYDKIILTVQEHANTSAASIPLALSVGVNCGKIKKGDLVLVDALGAGLTWGAGLIRWG